MSSSRQTVAVIMLVIMGSFLIDSALALEEERVFSDTCSYIAKQTALDLIDNDGPLDGNSTHECNEGLELAPTCGMPTVIDNDITIGFGPDGSDDSENNEGTTLTLCFDKLTLKCDEVVMSVETELPGGFDNSTDGFLLNCPTCFLVTRPNRDVSVFSVMILILLCRT
eukprot:284417_1